MEVTDFKKLKKKEVFWFLGIIPLIIKNTSYSENPKMVKRIWPPPMPQKKTEPTSYERLRSLLQDFETIHEALEKKNKPTS